MLAWKWWRDCRGRVLLYFGAAIAIGVFSTLDATSSYRWWMENYISNPARYQFYVFLLWSQVTYGLLASAIYGAVWTGLALAISSIGKDYASSGASFLLTRPQRRPAMLWIDFAFAIGTVAIAGALLEGSAIAVAARALPAIRTVQLMGLLPTLVAVAAAVYGLTIFWIVVTRSATKGIELSVATMMTVSLLPGALLEWWHIAWPEAVRGWMLKMFEWRPTVSYWITRVHPRQPSGRYLYYAGDFQPMMYRSLEPYPIAALAVWIGLALALVYASQKIVEYREV
jgi:hypothetical protein